MSNSSCPMGEKSEQNLRKKFKSMEGVIENWVDKHTVNCHMSVSVFIFVTQKAKTEVLFGGGAHSLWSFLSLRLGVYVLSVCIIFAV